METWISIPWDGPLDLAEWAWGLRDFDEFSLDLEWGYITFDPHSQRISWYLRSFVCFLPNFGLRSVEFGQNFSLGGPDISGYLNECLGNLDSDQAGFAPMFSLGCHKISGDVLSSFEIWPRVSQFWPLFSLSGPESWDLETLLGFGFGSHDICHCIPLCGPQLSQILGTFSECLVCDHMTFDPVSHTMSWDARRVWCVLLSREVRSLETCSWNSCICPNPLNVSVPSPEICAVIMLEICHLISPTGPRSQEILIHSSHILIRSPEFGLSISLSLPM